MITIGYGDYTPKSVNEKIYVIIMSCISAGVYYLLFKLNLFICFFFKDNNKFYK